MNKYIHIGVTLTVMVLSQIAYYYAALSNAIKDEAGFIVVERAVNPYLPMFDIYKSLIQVFLALVWMLVGWRIVKSGLAISTSFFWLYSTWNELADYLWGDQYIFKTEEWINLLIGLLISVTLYFIWRKNLSQP